MSSVEERIVKMVFDNGEFIKKIAGTISSLTQLNKATDQIATNSGGGLSAMSKAFEQTEVAATKAGFHIQDVWLKVASIFEYQIAGKIVSMSKEIANAMTLEGVADGFSEYELKMGSVQTILAGTGESLENVNKYLEELNKYSDQTIYSFADMTNNIGKFTNAGVKLEDAVAAIKGIANEAAISGANANEASRAMYNFSQALSAGYVKLIDWKSIENANMATKGFKDTLLEVASTVGTVEKQADGMYKVLTTNAQGKTMDELVSGTKNFNDSLQQQWMTTEVLTKALKIYATDVTTMSAEEKQLYEEELKAMGMTAEQILQFEELGTKATAAASEVKTFSMLKDTLKEAIGSGWAQTWEILIGDFEEAKDLWTKVSNVLGGFIDNMSTARNELLKGWDALGGRRVIIDSLKRAFDALVAVIKPIRDGFRNIFPPATAEDLLKISKAIQRFTANLMISKETADKVRQAASGFFSVFDIGLKLVRAFVNAILPAGKGVSSLGGFLLDAAARAGDFITKVDLVITKTQLFYKIFAKVGSVIKTVLSYLTAGANGVASFVGGFISGFTNAAKPITTFGEIFERVLDGVDAGLKNVQTKLGALKPLFEGVVSIFKGVGAIIGTIFKQIGESLSGATLGGNGMSNLMGVINALLSGGIMYKLYSSVKTFSSLGNILDSFGDAINAFSEKVQSETLMNVAKAIAILAGSLFVVAMVDSNKLAGATLAISTMVFSLAGSMALIMKAVNSFSTERVTSTFSIFGKKMFGMDATKLIEMSVTLGAVSKALVSMGAAILMMSVGLKVVASAAEGGHLWDSFAVVSLMLAELTTVALVLGKWGGESKKGAQGLIGMTTALVIMAEALKIVAGVAEGGNLLPAMVVITLLLGELTGVVILIDKFTKYKAMSMMPLISLAISLNLVVVALKKVSNALGSEGNHVLAALGVITILLGELVLASIAMSKFGGFAALGGAGALLAATSLLILVQALKQISDELGKTNQHVWQSLGVIAASLRILAVELTLMAGTIPGAMGLLVASSALVVLGSALKIIGSLKLSEIGKALIAIAGSLVILAVGLTGMVLALPGALALVVAAAGLTALAGALKIFGSMKVGEIAKALVSMVVALTGLAAITTVLSVFSPFILAFSAALLVFGAAMATTGAGLTLFSAGLTALIPILPMVGTAINTLGTALLSLLPIIVEKLLDALGTLATKIVEYGPQFLAATVTIINLILTAFSESAIKFGEATLKIILGILQVLTENIPKIAQAGADLMIAYIQAISTEIPRVVDEGYKCAIALINGLADAIENNNGDLIAAVDHLMDAVVQAITQWLVEFTPLGNLIPENIKEGIMSNELSVSDAIDQLIDNCVEKIKEKFPDFKTAAEYLLGGFIEGLKGTIAGRAISAVAEFGSLAIDALNSKKGLDEHSNSKKTIESGEYFVGGLVEGIENSSGDAIDAASLLGDNTVGALSDKLADGAISIEGSSDSIVASLKKAWNEVNNLGDASTANLGEERWGTTLKQANAAIQNQKANDGRWGSTLKAAEASKKASQASKQETAATEKNTKATEANAKTKEKSSKSSGKATKATKKEVDVMEYASGIVEAYTRNYGNLYKHLGDDAPMKVAEGAIKRLAEATYMASLKAKDATEQNEKTKASIEDMIKSFTEMKNKIYDSVKSIFEGDNFFQKFEVKTEKTMKELLENMKSNIDGVASWTHKLEVLGNKGLNEGLLKQLAELGPKGYEYVNAFSNATAEEIAKANEYFAQAGQLPEYSSNSILASYAQAGLNAAIGFADGIDKNAADAVLSAENLGKTSLKALQEVLEIQSPSRATYRDGRYLILGLVEGITNNTFSLDNTILVLCNRIKDTFNKELSKEKFFKYGQNIGLGLAEGMLSEESVEAVRNAAERLSEEASNITVDYNGISSPAKRYMKYGNYIAQGFAIGMTEGASYVQESALSLSQSISKALDMVATIAENDMELHPVISPVLDTTNLSKNAGLIGSLFPSTSFALASGIGIGRTAGGVSEGSQTQQVVPNQINFTQNNYSPKPLSRVEIYRDTKNTLSMMKGVVMANG